MIWSTIQLAVTSERHLQAMYNVVEACAAYVEAHDGQWPNSWEVIEPFYSFNSGVNERELVTIDFAAEPVLLAKQDWESFSGIRANGPVFLNYEFRMKRLIKLLRRYHIDELKDRRDDDG